MLQEQKSYSTKYDDAKKHNDPLNINAESEIVEPSSKSGFVGNVRFCTNTLEKGKNPPPILTVMGLAG